MANQRVPSSYEDVLLAIETQLVSSLGLDPSQVVFRDEDTDDFEPAGDLALTIIPGKLPLDLAAFAGGGNTWPLFRGQTKVVIWLRLDLDQEGWAKTLLTDKAAGILALFRRVFKALSLFDPKNDAGDYILSEPMRIVIGDVRPKRTQLGRARLAMVWHTFWQQDMT
jgi:hypothetical protein